MAKVLTETRMTLAEQQRQDWVVNAEEGTTIQDVLDPQYWAHVVNSSQIFLSPYDHIEVRLETGEWVAELLVLQVDRTWARVHLLHMHDLTVAETAPMPEPVKHRIEFKGPQRKHVVVRLTDGAVVKEGLATKAEAHQWLAAYERTTATT